MQYIRNIKSLTSSQYLNTNEIILCMFFHVKSLKYRVYSTFTVHLDLG